MNYVERVARNLKGCEYVSTGVCPGCDDCRALDEDYKVFEDDEGEVSTWSFHAADGLGWPTEEAAEAASREAFKDDWGGRDSVGGTTEFSREECDACGTMLAGYREVWHYIDPRGRLQHCEPGLCADCVAYIANGTLDGVTVHVGSLGSATLVWSVDGPLQSRRVLVNVKRAVQGDS